LGQFEVTGFPFGHEPNPLTLPLGVRAQLDADAKTLTTSLTYHGRISRLVQANCQECHRGGGIAPFPLETYEQVTAKSGMIRKMVEEDQYCVDIVKQSYAVERALKAFEAALLEGHLASCVPSGFREGRDQEMIRELGELFELSRK